jgi:hypothetical protein
MKAKNFMGKSNDSSSPNGTKIFPTLVKFKYILSTKWHLQKIVLLIGRPADWLSLAFRVIFKVDLI